MVTKGRNLGWKAWSKKKKKNPKLTASPQLRTCVMGVTTTSRAVKKKIKIIIETKKVRNITKRVILNNTYAIED